uniref:TIRC n=1 Tax=Branchiostoma belcheri tsingtauense TaxID=155462 RepID=A0A0A0UCC8_BRABE|nr:TIRC [Branchiostoma belcheri tsingtauense]
MLREGNVTWTTTKTVTRDGKTVKTKESGTGVPGMRLHSDPMFDLGMGNTSMDSFLSAGAQPRRASSPRASSPVFRDFGALHEPMAMEFHTTAFHTEVKDTGKEKTKKKEKDADYVVKEKKPGIKDKMKGFVSSSVSKLTSKPSPEEELTQQLEKATVSDLGPVEVFLSYQWDHQKQVIQLHDMLEEKGHSCWMDIKEMGGGDQLYAAIDKGMRQAKAVISCVTPKYTESANCRNEVALAHSLKKPIVPVLLEKTAWPPEGPMATPFAQLLYIDFTKESKKNPWQGAHLDELMTSVGQAMKQ